MEIKKRFISISEDIKVVKLKVKTGNMVYDGQILLIYEELSNKSDGIKQKKLKSPEVGVIKSVLIKEGDTVTAGSPIIELDKKCNHPTIIKDLCAECGADLQKEILTEGSPVTQASFSMIHMVPELKVNEELAQILGKADIDRLLEEKKLVLLVDLDQTLIHTTNDNIPNNIKDVCHFQLYGPRSPWYHTRLRPGTHKFLHGISSKYELHICTFGSRRYAHTIAKFLDPDGKYFSHRILSRDECFDANSKTANLRALFPCGEQMVCIIDDREDVWDYALNLIHVKPYHFFQHTGDIHAPPGLSKCENDDTKHGFDFSNLNNPLIDKETIINEKETCDETSIVNENEGKNIDTAETEFEILNVNNNVDQNNESIVDESKFKLKEDILIKNTNLECDDVGEQETNDVLKTVMPEVDKDELNKEKIDLVENNELKIETDDVEKMQNSNELKIEIDDVEKMQNSNELKIETDDVEKMQNSNQENFIVETNENMDTTKQNLYDFITIEESDDYLLYLEEILKIIHTEFFKRYETTKEIPDLKNVIPETRGNILKDVNVVFSGIVPNNVRLEESQAYKIANSLGAKVTQNIEPDTTHLVALQVGTAKVHAAYKRKNLQLVTPEWLWTCAERWEKVDERLFLLDNTKCSLESRHPPAHCRSPDHPSMHFRNSEHSDQLPFTYSVNSKSSPEEAGNFLYTINPLMSLSSEDIETMEGEVEDIFKESDDESDESSEQEDEEDTRHVAKILKLI